MKISRKTFFKGLAAGTLGLPLLLRACADSPSSPAPSAKSNNGQSPTYTWKMTTTWPPNFPIMGEACQLFADMVAKMSAGRLQIRVYGGGELAPPLEAFEVVRSGAVEMASSASYYWAGKITAAPLFSSVPFGMNAQQLMCWIITGGGQELWDEMYKPHNIKPLLGGNTGVQMGGWFNKPIEKLADLKGLKMRIPGLGGKVLEKAGGSPVLLAGSELYTGLERGIIDAAEWIGPYHDTLMGFHEIARYYYAPGWQETGTALEYIINLEAYNQLPEDLQTILQAAAAQSYIWSLARMEAANANAFAELKQKGVVVKNFPPSVLRQLRAYSEQVLTELTAKDDFAARVYESYQNFRRPMVDYSAISEKMYYTALQ